MWATISTSASGAASSAASTPPGRGARTWTISSARTAIRSRPSLRSLAIARSRRAAVKLPPSGKITKASLWSRPVASDAIWDSRSSPAAGFGEMKRAGTRLRITSIAGSQARVFFRTTRGSRWYQCSRAYISTNESPGPAWRHITSTGPSGTRDGCGPSVRIRSASTRRASRKKTISVPCTRS